jgi:hypothetical protein
MDTDKRDSIAHEMNNCLHVVTNALHLLSRQLDPMHPEARANLDMAIRNAERAATLAQRLVEKS